MIALTPTTQTLAARVAQLAAACQQEVQQAFEKAPGREHDVVSLMLVDACVYPRTEAMDQLRKELGLLDPVVPSADEHGRLNRMLYMVHGLGKASATEVGG